MHRLGFSTKQCHGSHLSRLNCRESMNGYAQNNLVSRVLNRETHGHAAGAAVSAQFCLWRFVVLHPFDVAHALSRGKASLLNHIVWVDSIGILRLALVAFGSQSSNVDQCCLVPPCLAWRAIMVRHCQAGAIRQFYENVCPIQKVRVWAMLLNARGSSSTQKGPHTLSHKAQPPPGKPCRRCCALPPAATLSPPSVAAANKSSSLV